MSLKYIFNLLLSTLTIYSLRRNFPVARSKSKFGNVDKGVEMMFLSSIIIGTIDIEVNIFQIDCLLFDFSKTSLMLNGISIEKPGICEQFSFILTY